MYRNICRMGLRFWGFLIIVGFTFHGVAASPAASASAEIKVESHLLTNGMKLLIHEDHSIPSVVLYVFYKIGSRNEGPGRTGLSHFFEHMMFNGAKKYGPKEFDRVMEAAGGANNAYTDQDVTVYQDWFPTSAVELIFEMERDRIEHLAFVPAIIESERNVVASERRTSVEANNGGLLDEQLWATAYVAHPYQWPVIGWMSDIEHWTMADLKHHFEMGYAPNNAITVVAGDIKASEALALAQRYLQPISPRSPPPPVTTEEPEQMGERRVKVVKFAQLPILEIAYHIGRTADPDYYPLRMLQTILFFGQSSRLYLRLVDHDQVAISVDGGMKFALDPTLFSIYVQPKENVPVEKVEATLYDELKKLQTQPVTDRELAKARNALLASFYRQLKTIDGKAHALGNYELFLGDYRKLFSAAAEYEKVTAADIQRVARQYFKEANRTVAVLMPEKEDSQQGREVAK
jgi:zinc protease